MKKGVAYGQICLLTILLGLWASHNLFGMRPLLIYHLELDGIRMATASADSIGGLSFQFELPTGYDPEARHTWTVNAVGSPDFQITAPVCWIEPSSDEGGSD